MSGGADARDKAPLPWLNLVATGGGVLEFKWNRFHNTITITEDGKRAVYSGVPWACACAVAAPQLTQGSHWFELQIINTGDRKGGTSLMFGCSAPRVRLGNSCEDMKGCVW